jgi:lipid-A-disaccharide synthase-like uncharacterized protein
MAMILQNALPMFMQSHIFGGVGAAMFSSRFIVQWLHSERAGKVVIPDMFWYLSIAGGLLTLFYALAREEPVFAIGQAVGLLVYFRNLRLSYKAKNLF